MQLLLAAIGIVLPLLGTMLVLGWKLSARLTRLETIGQVIVREVEGLKADVGLLKVDIGIVKDRTERQSPAATVSRSAIG